MAVVWHAFDSPVPGRRWTATQVLASCGTRGAYNFWSQSICSPAIENNCKCRWAASTDVGPTLAKVGPWLIRDGRLHMKSESMLARFGPDPVEFGRRRPNLARCPKWPTSIKGVAISALHRRRFGHAHAGGEGTRPVVAAPEGTCQTPLGGAMVDRLCRKLVDDHGLLRLQTGCLSPRPRRKARSPR